MLAQRRDDILIESEAAEKDGASESAVSFQESVFGRVDYRRRRSLKFRFKMRELRDKLFGNPFHKKDREAKNENKVIAAKRRRRDGTGKFNFEPMDTPVVD